MVVIHLFKVMNRQINSIVFELKKEREEIITDAPNYLMVLQFNFYKKNERDANSILISIHNTIKEIHNTLLLNRLRLLLREKKYS